MRMAPVRVQVALAVLAETQPMCGHVGQSGEDQHVRGARSAACQVLRLYLHGEQDYTDAPARAHVRKATPARRKRRAPQAPEGGAPARAEA